MNRTALILGFISFILIFTLFRSPTTEHYDIEINGSTQHLYIESESKDNPILLFLHWGPGLSEAPYKDLFNSKLKDHATIVHWDQRGAGKSYISTQFENLSVETYIQDTLEVMSHLREKFNQDKILLVGHSWGSLIGINIAERHPELLHAYVSISQIVNTLKSEQLSYEFVLRKTKESGQEALHNQLLNIGNPPYKKPEHWGLQRQVLHDFGGILYGMTNDDYMAFTQKHVNAFKPFSEEDKKNYMSAYQKSVQALFGELLMTDISDKTYFNVPIYFMLGEQDYTVVSSIGADYFASISAPKKQLYRFVNSAHSPHIEESNKYQELMIRIVKELH
jgi:pimeloyl-ACP methyl ester carboxylesterase